MQDEKSLFAEINSMTAIEIQSNASIGENTKNLKVVDVINFKIHWPEFSHMI